MLSKPAITVFSDCHSTFNVPDELEKVWETKGVQVENLHYEPMAYFVAYQFGSVAEIYSFFGYSSRLVDSPLVTVHNG